MNIKFWQKSVQSIEAGVIIGWSLLLVQPITLAAPTLTQTLAQINSNISTSCDLGSLPKHAGNYKTRGSKLLTEAKYLDAIDCFDRANQINPNDPEVWNGRGVALARLKQFDAAISSYDKAIAIPPGKLALNSSKRKIERKDYYLWWFNRGTALADLQKHEDALASYTQSLQIEPIFEPAWYYKGITLSKLNRPFQDSIAAYDISKQIALARIRKPQDITGEHLTWYSNGIKLAASGQYEQAIEAYDRAIQLRADSFPMWYFKGIALFQLNRYQEALTAFDRVVQLAPEFSQGWQSRGEVLHELGQEGEAISSYEKAINIDKFWNNGQSVANAWYGRGVALYSLGRYGESIASIDRTIKISPDFPKAKELRELAISKVGK